MDQSSPPPGSSASKTPTLWIVIAGVCAVLAIGFAIWAFSLKSDRDDTQAQLTAARSAVTREQGQLSEEERSAAELETKEKAFGERFKSRYNTVRNRFIAEEKDADQLKDDITSEKQKLTAAQNAEASAESQDATEQAQLRTANSQLSLAAACARGTIAALDEFLDAPSVRSGANRALSRLEALQNQCNEVVQDAGAN